MIEPEMLDVVERGVTVLRKFRNVISPPEPLFFTGKNWPMCQPHLIRDAKRCAEGLCDVVTDFSLSSENRQKLATYRQSLVDFEAMLQKTPDTHWGPLSSQQAASLLLLIPTILEVSEVNHNDVEPIALFAPLASDYLCALIQAAYCQKIGIDLKYVIQPLVISSDVRHICFDTEQENVFDTFDEIRIFSDVVHTESTLRFAFVRVMQQYPGKKITHQPMSTFLTRSGSAFPFT